MLLNNTAYSDLVNAATHDKTGTARLTAGAPASGIADGISDLVTVRGPQFQYNVGTAPATGGTGTRMIHYVYLPSNPTAPVNVTLTSENPAVALLAPYNTTNDGTKSIDVTIPTSTNVAYFDLLGVAPSDVPKLTYPYGVARDSSGNLYIAEYGNHRVRKVDGATGVISTIAGTGTAGFSGDGGPATAAQLSHPTDVTLDSGGNIYIVDYSNTRIRRIDAGTGNIATYAGTGTAGFSGDGGLATAAWLNYPTGIALDSANNLYIADFRNDRVRKVTAVDGKIATCAGTGIAGFSGDGGLATSAQLYGPYNITVDAGNNLYIAEHYNNRIRKVTAIDAKIATIAGNGTAGFSGDGGPATSAQLNTPTDVGLDGSGNVYIADWSNQRIRKIDAGAGTITTVVGGGNKLGDEGPGVEATLSYPAGVTALADGTLYITDYSNHRVRKLDTVGIIHTVAGSGVAGFAGDGGPATGVRITATASGMVTGEIPVQVLQSQFLFSGLASATGQGTANPFSIYINVPNYGMQRAATNTAVTLTSNNPAVLTVPASVPIATNATYAAASATAIGGGSATITASSPGSGIDAVGSSAITVNGLSIPAGQQNLSLLAGTTATASTSYNASYRAALAIDGIVATSSSWGTADYDPAPMLTVTLPSDVTVYSIQIATAYSPSYDFLTGSFKLYDASSNLLYNSGVVSLTNGAINHPVSGGPLAGVRRAEFIAATWKTASPTLSELAVVGTNP